MYAARSLCNTDRFGMPNRKDLDMVEFHRHNHFFSGEENNRRVVQNTISEIQRQVPEGFCRCSCSYPGLEPSYINRNPLHKHLTDVECRFGSSHRLHCVFAAHRLGRCVVGPSTTITHDHCVVGEEESRITAEEQQTTSAANPLNKMTIAETEDERNNENTPYSLSYELEALVGQPSFHDSERVLQDMHTWTTPHDMPLSPSLESRPVSPSIEIFSEVPPNLERTDNLPDLVDIATIQRNSRALMTTPEPPEMPR
ncbi:hypothetical protein F5Y08DRAFT_300565 [Xylaria arbuscula]|nr:hypothetical protein F5Y08DRAFT_300565 [Xylaria arbuscula]